MLILGGDAFSYGRGVHVQGYLAHKRLILGLHRGTELLRKRPPSWDPPRTLGMGLRWGPRGVRFLMSDNRRTLELALQNGPACCFRRTALREFSARMDRYS